MSNDLARQIRRQLWTLRIASTLLLVSIPALRKVYDRQTHHIPEGVGWERVDLNGRRAEWLSPPDAPSDAVLLRLHGGGGVLGISNSTRWMTAHLSLACRLPSLLLDYRLAPEHPFPAGVEDCVAAYRWLLAEGVAPDRIVMVGDSAGAYIMLSMLLVARDAGLPLPAAAVGISPPVDPTLSGPSMRTNAWRDALLSPAFARRTMRLYVGNHPLDDPYLSPLVADLHGLPPLLFHAGGDEVLLDDARRFSDCARAAGVDMTLEIWPHMWHTWHYCVPELPEANQAMKDIARFIDRHTELSRVPDRLGPSK